MEVNAMGASAVAELLGDLTDRTKYTEGVLKGMLGVIRNEELHHTTIIGKIGIVPLSLEQLNKLKYVDEANQKTAFGSDIATAIRAEMTRRTSIKIEFESLFRTLYAGAEYGPEKVMDAIQRYEEAMRSSSTSFAPPPPVPTTDSNDGFAARTH